MTKQELNKCMNLLAQIYALNRSNNHTKELTLELGTILKKQTEQEEMKTILDPNKLYQDNVKLTEEINSIKKSCIKLTELINQKIPSINNTIEQLYKQLNNNTP